ncbi:acyclic terpene utilization AtuA family protein [Streptomyces sp. RP5T]|uniref:acyclic terpene utilization AtuA family protein n=1 Tax=Streptomyces sp. RP5T TaxID=2490848 RepID=UPI000F646CBC|nr:acyclic terpene utilization AtuA family protein [Streptomyces sp. RP5T]RRR75456.1 acyclic terpene utilization AtuA family protein [Streptomyces sp. RP5T]
MELRILAPTGALGAGFDADAFARGVAARPDVIACDAGSTDSGPAALGSGTPKLSSQAVTRDLRLLLKARDELGVPLIIGSCGTSGRDAGVDQVAEIAGRIAAEENLSFKLGLIYSDQPAASLQELYDAGRIKPLANAPAINRELFERSHTVAMMGIEPIQEALEAGCDVVLAGRASDTALFAAVPHLRGAAPGLTWHMAKTIECGAACAIPPSANPLLVTLRDDHFDVTTLADGSRLTPRSVAAHTLYENADPYHIAEPSGVLDTSEATYEAVDGQTVRVRGARYIPADGYTNKLEGAELVGYQTVIIGGVRDRIVVDALPKLLPAAKNYFESKIRDVFNGDVDPASVDIDYRLYGAGAVLADREPTSLDPAELGVLITITASDQATAHTVATFVAHASSHLPIAEYDGLVSTLAYPYSPPEMDRGPLYRFTLNHVVTGITPTELFRTVTQEL